METTNLAVPELAGNSLSLPNLVQVRFVFLATKRIPAWALVTYLDHAPSIT